MSLAASNTEDLGTQLEPEQHEKRRARLAELRDKEWDERRVILSTMPAHVTLEMTARCNLTCSHCRRFHVHEEASPTRGALGQDAEFDLVGASGYMDDDVFEHCLELVRDTDWVSLTGYGEPMMHPKFFDYVDRLKARGHILDSITNGTLLTEKNCKRLVDSGFDQVSVSIDGVEDETLKIVRGVGADVLFGGLERLANEKRSRGLGRHDAPRLSINFAMGRFNIREMPALARRLANLDIHVFYSHILDVGASPEMLGPHLIWTDAAVREEAVRLIEETEAICRENGIHTDFRAIPQAIGGHESEGIDLDSAFEVFAEAVRSNPPPKRQYIPVAAIEQQRREQIARIKAEMVQLEGAAPTLTSSPCKTAGPDTLSEQEKRENERCSDLFRYAFVAWNGKVISCCFERFGVGDLNLQSAEEVWNGEMYQKLRKGVFEDGIRWVCDGCTRIMD